MLVPIGVFSEMTRLSINMLRRYDESGLLVPAEVDGSTGYRYYSPAQAARAEAIRSLRALDVPLDDVAAILSADDAEARQLLASHRDRLVAEAERHRAMLGAVDRLLDGDVPVVPYAVVTETVPDLVVLACPKQVTIDTIAEHLAAGFAAVLAGADSASLAALGPPFVEFVDVIDDDRDGTIVVCVPIEAPTDTDTQLDEGLEVRTLAGGPIVSTVHRGPYETIAPAYHVLNSWIHEHGHRIAGPPREIYLNDPTDLPPDEIETRVQWPYQ